MKAKRLRPWPASALAWALVLSLGFANAEKSAAAAELRVCADPDNLPFSNAKGEGFENRIVEVIAAALGREVAYTWRPQRRGFIRNTLKAGLCDLVPGVPAGLEMLATTRPYYRGAFVFVSRAGRGLALGSLDDPRLRDLRLGVQMIGDDGANAPPAHALARRGIIDNVVGFPVYDAGRGESPHRRIIEAVANGEIDAALVWGPIAGPLAKRQAVPLTLADVRPRVDGPTLPMVFDISMGLRREDVALKQEVEAALAGNRDRIDAILSEAGVPRLDAVRPPGPGQ